MKDSIDVVIHINDEVNSQDLKSYSSKVKKILGVSFVSLRKARPHLMIVTYNPRKTKAFNVLEGVKRTGVNAQLVW